MRFNMFFLLIMFFVSSINIKACDLPYGCVDKVFPYFFCENGISVTKCSSNPYNETSNGQLLTPLKMDVCLNYEKSTYKVLDKTIKHFETIKIYHMEPIGEDEDSYEYYGIYDGESIYDPYTGEEMTDYIYGEYIYVPYATEEDEITYETIKDCNKVFKNESNGDVYFNYDDVQTNVYKALDTWSGICNPCQKNSDYLQQCCIPIKWTQNPDDFWSKRFNPETTQGYATREFQNCTFDCSNSGIYLNQTRDFTGAGAENVEGDDPCDYDDQFFLTGSSAKSDWWSLTAVLMHEIGHLFGFGDQYLDPGTNCRHSGSIMDNTDFENPNRTLSDDDKCMYMKMYCWTPVNSVENSTTDLMVNIYPNPSLDNIINIDYNNSEDEILTYDIITPLGNSVLSGVIQPNESPKSINMVNNYAGVYYIILNYHGQREIKKFVITK